MLFYSGEKSWNKNWRQGWKVWANWHLFKTWAAFSEIEIDSREELGSTVIKGSKVPNCRGETNKLFKSRAFRRECNVTCDERYLRLNSASYHCEICRYVWLTPLQHKWDKGSSDQNVSDPPHSNTPKKNASQGPNRHQIRTNHPCSIWHSHRPWYEESAP